jgi:asparagine synthase (glutamine-hydrolysing)
LRLLGTFAGAGAPPEIAGTRLHVWKGVECALDGMIYNAPALATWTGADPAAPVEELVARGFRSAGEDVFRQLRGDFVVMVWDAERRVGAVARDRSGARPLHFTGGTTLRFASELGDLLAELPTAPPPDDVWLAHWLARRVAPPASTPYAGIERLPAGCLLRLGAGGWSRASWWQPRPAPLPEIDAPAAAAALREEMDAAVGRSLAGAEAPGLMLSGGFDSVAVAGLAAARLRTAGYSGVFPLHPVADESERIRLVRRALPLRGVEQSLEGGGALRATLEFTRAWGVPPATPNVFMWRDLMRRAALDGTDVLLDGEGGDELFGCSPALLADLLRHGRVPALVRMARSIPGMGASPRPRWVRRALWRYGVRGAIPAPLHAAARRARHRAAPGPPWMADPLRSLLDGSREDDWKRLRGPRWWAALLHATGPGADALGMGDQFRREGSDAGLRLAHPWRDSELIDFVLRLPPQLAFDARFDRPLARDAMRGLIPDVVRLGESKPYFNDPLADALDGPDRAVLEELFATPALARYVRPDRIADLLPRRPRPAWPLDTWRVASAAAWLRMQEDPAALDSLIERAPSTVTSIRDSASAPTG